MKSRALARSKKISIDVRGKKNFVACPHLICTGISVFKPYKSVSHLSRFFTSFPTWDTSLLGGKPFFWRLQWRTCERTGQFNGLYQVSVPETTISNEPHHNSRRKASTPLQCNINERLSTTWVFHVKTWNIHSGLTHIQEFRSIKRPCSN